MELVAARRKRRKIPKRRFSPHSKFDTPPGSLSHGTRTVAHARLQPEPGDPDRKPFLDTLTKVSEMARTKGVTVAFETGQETADLLRLTLDELSCPNIKVNFDPANMLLYDKGDPIRAVELLGPDIRSVHVKDAIRTKTPGTWGEEVPLGHGQANIKK